MLPRQVDFLSGESGPINVRFLVWSATQKTDPDVVRVKTAVKLAGRYEMPRALLDLAVVKEADRAENRADAISRLKNLGSVIPCAESWLLGDQYDEDVVAPDFDLAGWEKKMGRFLRLSEAMPDGALGVPRFCSRRSGAINSWFVRAK